MNSFIQQLFYWPYFSFLFYITRCVYIEYLGLKVRFKETGPTYNNMNPSILKCSNPTTQNLFSQKNCVKFM